MEVYTLGYEKRSIDEYIKILKNVDVKILIDVREIAWSYKRDFCKVKFSEALKNVGIEYIHVKELGNPRVFRKGGLDTTDILKKYKHYLKTTEAGIERLISLIHLADERNVNICLTCYERDSSCCHRSIITEHVNSVAKAIMHL